MPLVRLKDEYLEQDGVRFLMADEIGNMVACKVSHVALRDHADRVHLFGTDSAVFEAYRELIEDVASESRYQKRAAIRSRRPLLAFYVAFVPHTVLKGPSRASSAPKQNTLIGFDLLCRNLAVGQSLLECLCICGLFDFPRGVEFDEMGAEVEQPNSNAERIVVASLRMGIPLPRQKSGRPRTSAQNAALRLTVAAKTCW
jgi:hypothetical protein